MLEHRLQFAVADRTWNNNHLLVTLVQAARTVVFDAGPMSLPRSIAHQVTDICISHRHMDHLEGFTSLARTLLASHRPVRVIGPRGIADALSNLLRAFEWNYKAELSLRLDVTEVVDTEQVTFHRLDIRKGFAVKPRGEAKAREAVLHRDKELTLAAFDVDHHIPCLAYRLKLPDEWRVDPDGVAGLGLKPGPWLGALLKRLAAGEQPRADERVPPGPAQADPPEVSLQQVVERAIGHVPGLMVGYVTDTGDTPSVRKRLAEHLAGVDVLFCEAFYAKSETAVARKVGHLTSIQAGEIAQSLGAKHLVITHISQRYNPARIMREVRSVFPGAEPKTRFLLGDTEDESGDDAPAL